jgi:DNA-binding CsgD family transcriptional regulator
LLERDADLARLEGLIGQAAGGEGRLVLVEGEAGIGKTALLDAAADVARRAEMETLAAHGTELEREFAWGVARQLYEPALRSASTERRADLLSGAAALAAPILGLAETAPAVAPAPAATVGVNHGLYWLTANLSDRCPLLVVVDDAHWADPATLLFAAYLGRRVDELPVLVALGLRSAEPGAPRPLIEALRELPTVERITPEPLSLSGTAELIGRTLGRSPEEGFLRSCREATGGNPFLLRELLRALASEGIQPADRTAEHVARLGPRSISRSVLGRLATMWPEAVSLAQALAVLGTQAELHLAARLAGLAPAVAETAADALADARVLAPGRPLRFEHPIIRQSIYEDLPAGRRSNAHARAARLLEASGEPDRAAVQLLATGAAADAWVVERLRSAAARAIAGGAPGEAVDLLRRALAEPPAPGARAEVLVELGRAELLAGEPAAAEHLQAALALSTEPRSRAQIAATLSAAVAPGGQVVEATRLLEAVLDELPASEAELAHLVEGHLIGLSVLHRSLIRKMWDRLDRFDPDTLGDSPGDRVLLGWLAARSMLRGDSASEALTLARRALGEGRLMVEQLAHSQHYTITASIAGFCDHLEEAHANFSAGIYDSRRRGSETGFAIGSCFRSWFSLRLGRLAAAEADARSAVEVAERSPFMVAILRYALYSLAEVLVLQGRLDEAERELRRAGAALEQVEFSDVGLILHSRGLLELARRRPAAAREDLLAAGRISVETEFLNPSWLPWRSNAALASHALGEREAALALATEELERARGFGAPRAVGMALRALGLITGGDDGLALLRGAASTLEATQARLEHARALISLGAALRRANRRSDAREPLRLGLDVTHRCGAVLLADEAMKELSACGARPRRLVVSGVDSLTASERRVAAMAAEGMSNTEIAQALFVTRKTVEKHLGQVYMKLKIRSRGELPAALAGDLSPAC